MNEETPVPITATEVGPSTAFAVLEVWLGGISWGMWTGLFKFWRILYAYLHLQIEKAEVLWEEDKLRVTNFSEPTSFRQFVSMLVGRAMVKDVGEYKLHRVVSISVDVYNLFGRWPLYRKIVFNVEDGNVKSSQIVTHASVEGLSELSDRIGAYARRKKAELELKTRTAQLEQEAQHQAALAIRTQQIIAEQQSDESQ